MVIDWIVSLVSERYNVFIFSPNEASKLKAAWQPLVNERSSLVHLHSLFSIELFKADYQEVIDTVGMGG